MVCSDTIITNYKSRITIHESHLLSVFICVHLWLKRISNDDAA